MVTGRVRVRGRYARMDNHSAIVRTKPLRATEVSVSVGVRGMLRGCGRLGRRVSGAVTGRVRIRVRVRVRGKYARLDNHSAIVRTMPLRATEVSVRVNVRVWVIAIVGDMQGGTRVITHALTYSPARLAAVSTFGVNVQIGGSPSPLP